ncbi:uncharacterized protein BYT42DRAFT_609571 [Radiomyces spectabilis]|uniref:uncharacterized protein n=1 Tax=Radiomyces spectabilis TaxID=64574 RepID=UPI002220A034|nr:uncharacterized protein BYT42DRAFT_609571 [Radiomyces spectabilis]KAI8393804.1 hypothetical protein BYT42DRAFT_609571 [Radiomyces spectabilis]
MDKAIKLIRIYDLSHSRNISEKTGYKKTNKKVEELRKSSRSLSNREPASIESLEKQLLSLKGLYDTQFNELRFLNYKGQHRMQAEMMNIFVYGGRKYDKRKARKRKKYRKEQKGKKRKGKKKERWGTNIGGGLPDISGMCQSILKKAENQGLFVVVPIYFTGLQQLPPRIAEAYLWQ